ncbi:interferon-induced very large GTPase 1-like isoform X1 [Mauremys reevesii]|uniref:interferon-induced very large GTPase 1-like isoform X1 n=2 Tax=Mauremys reevesii TaxID=260615 RepID=UPI00193F3340|nr:interferon-induced very large GTPase 1-like isoform X1 [Mauremys reevesii]XP_039389816.1 interferon-induced very large GTPase 1-like isoform X1 [Mauremys reevesii]
MENRPENQDGPVFPEKGPESHEDPASSMKGNAAMSAPAGITASLSSTAEEPVGDGTGAYSLASSTKGPRDSVTAITAENYLEMIHRERNKLVNLLQNDADNVLDELLCQSVITMQEYDGVNKEDDTRNRMRKLLILIPRKGGLTCMQFLESLQRLYPDLQQHLQYSGDESVIVENRPRNLGGSESSETVNPQVLAPAGNMAVLSYRTEDPMGDDISGTAMSASTRRPWDSVTAATDEKALEMIHKVQDKLIKLLQNDADKVLDELLCQSVITQQDYDQLNKGKDAENKIRILLVVIQRKGGPTCKQFLECLQSLFPDVQQHIQYSVQVSAPTGETSAVRPMEEEVVGELGSSATLTSSAARSPDSVTVVADEKSLKIMCKERRKLIKIIQNDPGGVLDESLAQSLITDEDYDNMTTISDTEAKIRKLLIQIQRKGALACQQFLECLETMFPGTNQDLQHPQGGLNQESQTLQATELGEKEVINPKLELDIQEDRKREETDLSKERSKAFQDILSRLNLEKHRSRKIRLRDVLEICPGGIKNRIPEALSDLPWHFLRKVMAVNGTARNTSIGHKAPEEEMSDDNKELHIDDNFYVSDAEIKVSLHPLDVLCAILLYSDSFLQQEILSKMSMCQFALPLLLPALDIHKCTLLLWAMRDIVRKWRPHSLAESRGFREESLVLTAMPTISFVRLGSCSFSKSKLLNDVLSPSQQHHNFFIHRDMESGNVPREIADGLVEISWYFPGGNENSDLFPEPVAVTNLRGDIETQWLQFSFLTEVSSAMFIVTESISEREYELLSSLKESTAKYYFILNYKNEKPIETLGFLNKLAPVLKLSKSQLLVKDSTTNNAGFVKKVQSTIGNIMNSSPKTVSLEAMAVMARDLGIQVDEDCQACQCARKCAEEITVEIRDVAKYKREMLRLQGDPWKNLAKVEKELCRMKSQGDMATEDYKSELKQKWLEIRRQQNQCGLTNGLTKFINGIEHLPTVEKHYFLKWMKFSLDNTARGNLSKMRAEYKKKCETPGADRKQLEKLDKLIADSSLGVEHFIRELGQFYEAECSIVKEGNKAENQRQFIHLPAIAADLMLEGFPMELIDGDASNIPMNWVVDVLTHLNIRLGGRSRMVVITVLGVQSTGKSTLLNTMFGLQFAVSSGRCTRGAFMTLIKVTEAVQKLSGCDFILVIDTEGLKAPELTTLEDSYQHDNELATLVIGLSDITIVNMAMENATEMKDILQIVVHAFLRMEEIGQKPNCQFVHQNVSDVSAHDQNMRDRKHLLEQLNEMTKAAARMEKQSREMVFSDIMEYNPEKHNWYIPGLWHGVPPMAPVNTGYSESVCELKKHLFEFIENRSRYRAVKDIPEFIEWLKSLWNAVKHENFIFSFRNSLVAEAYNQLSMKYSEWEWDFRKKMYSWISDKETFIQNQPPEKLEGDPLASLKIEAQGKLQEEEKKLLDNLEQYFKSGASNLNLIEKYREDFKRSANSLKRELESYSISNCEEAIRIQRGQHKIDTIQTGYKQTIEGKVDRLLAECRNRKHKLDNEKLKIEFETMWRKTLSELKLSSLQKRQVVQDMDLQLRKDFENRGSAINQMLQHAKSLLGYRMKSFTMKKEYLELKWTTAVVEFFLQDCHRKTEELALSLMDECKKYIEEKVKSKTDYDETYCGELLHMVNERLKREDVQKLPTTPSFEVDLKLHILGEAACAFQKMHEDFIKENDPQQRLEKLKPQYFSIFMDLYLEKDESQTRAKDFCYQCLKPALVSYVNKRLGLEIVDNFLSSEQAVEYASRSFFQLSVLKKLLEEMNFDNYVKYIRNYEKFVKSWIQRCLIDHYGGKTSLRELEKGILSTIINKIKGVLKNSINKNNKTVSAFLDSFCKELQQDLVISCNSLVGVQFKSTAKIEQLSDNIRTFLLELEQQILTQFNHLQLDTKLSNLSVKPQDEIFKRVFGCGKQCPFCKAPCEAGGTDHKEHFVSVHRPKGLGNFRDRESQKLEHSICSSDVVSNREFQTAATAGKFHPFKDYRHYYPDWHIQPDPSIDASDYWKFVFKSFNDQFARKYDAKAADLPRDWKNITKEDALRGLKQGFYLKK